MLPQSMETIELPLLQSLIDAPATSEEMTGQMVCESGAWEIACLPDMGGCYSEALIQLNCQWLSATRPENSLRLKENHNLRSISKAESEIAQSIKDIQNFLAENNSEINPHSISKERSGTLKEGPVSIFALAGRQAAGRTSASKNSSTPSSSSLFPQTTAKQTSPAAIAKSPFSPDFWSKGRSDKKIDPDGRGQGGGSQQQSQDEGSSKDKKQTFEKKIEADRKASIAHAPSPPALTDINGLYLRFMELMTRILGQAEAEAHELYQKIKHRTDQIEQLTTLLQKINNEPKGIDWSNRPDMIRLLDQARAIGVDIPAGKLKWTEEEKKVLKENIQMRKDSMEKITQLERTDMQRYLQEASQCHQARSNILKMMKEVIDTLIHNIRPG